MLNPHVFRAYDVRGLVGSDITPDVFRLVGSAYGTLIRRNGGRRIAGGQDNRRSADARKAAFVATVSRLVKPARRLKVVVDAGNGVAGLYAPDLLRRIGCEIVELHCESDGSFPNHLPDPEDAENVVDLQARVVEVGADLGVAYDGDADRVGIIDERG